MKYSTDAPIPTLDENFGDTITIHYNDDLNLYMLHEAVRKNFGAERKEGEMMIKEGKSYLKKINKVNKMKPIDINYYKIKSEELIIKGTKLSSENRWNEYLELSKSILDVFELYMSDSERGIIGAVKKSKDREKIKKRIELIEEYISILKTFFDVLTYRDIHKFNKCPLCGTAKIIDESNNDCYVCKCGYCEEIICKDVSCQENGQLVVEKDNNLISENIKRYCGKKNDVNIPPTLYTKLDEILKKSGMKNGSHYRSLPIQKIIHKEKINNKHGTSVRELLSMLKESSNSNMYDSVNIIGSIYYGWILPDLTEHEPYILRIGYEAKKIYSDFQNKHISNLNGNVILYFIIEYLNIPFDINDFKLMSTKDTLDKYRDIWNKISSEKVISDIKDEHRKNIKIMKKKNNKHI